MNSPLASTPKYPVQTLEKALEVIEILKNGPSEGLRIKELSDKLGMGKSTVHRILDTLAAYRYVEKVSGGTKYRLSWKLFEIGNVIPRQRNLENIDVDILRNVCEKFRETVNLGIRVNSTLVIVSKVDPQQVAIKAGLYVGEQEPLHATAMGKVLICEQNISEIFNVEPLEQYTPRTITSLEALEEHLKLVREQGYAVDDEEYSIGLFCIAMPVRNYNSDIVAALSISGPAFRLNYSKIINIREELKEACEKLSLHFGSVKL
jgi:IclR family transcriptional regulator, KDG regulon repressor